MVLGLAVWTVGVFAGRWGLATSSEFCCVAEERTNENEGKIESSGCMAFGLAAEEISYQCEESGSSENANHIGGYGGRHHATGMNIKRAVRKRVTLCEETERIVSSKRLITYFVFGLCKILD